MLRAALFLLLSSCGSAPLLNDGIYDVSIHYTKDSICYADGECTNNWPLSQYDKTIEAQWKISQGEGYKLAIVKKVKDKWQVVTEYKGVGKRDHVLFLKETKPLGDCKEGGELRIELYPNESGNKFVGFGSVVTNFCEDGGLETNADFRGQKLNEN